MHITTRTTEVRVSVRVGCVAHLHSSEIQEVVWRTEYLARIAVALVRAAQETDQTLSSSALMLAISTVCEIRP